MQYIRRFSKILPHKDNIASKSLSGVANDINIKKIKVNAQVTAMTSLLEFSCNIFYTMVFKLITKRTSFASLITVMSTYLVILPYAFLMNTPQNKNQIVEIGWNVVLKNIFQGAFSTDSPPNADKNAKNNIRTSTGTTKSCKHNQLENRQKPGIPTRKEECNQNKTKIYTVSSPPLHPSVSHSCNKTSNDTVDNTEPSTSTGRSHRKHWNPGPFNETINNTDLETASSTKDMIHNTITKMKENLEQENLYIAYFKVLIALYSDRIQPRAFQDISIQDLIKNHELLNNRDADISIGYSDNLTSYPNSIENAPVVLRLQKIFRESLTTPLTPYKVNKDDRKVIRDDLLSQLEYEWNIDKKFDRLVEELIENEECFINGR